MLNINVTNITTRQVCWRGIRDLALLILRGGNCGCYLCTGPINMGEEFTESPVST